MSDVTVPFAGKAQENATLLLAAAEEKGEDASVVRTTLGAFIVDEEIAKAAGVDYDSGEAEEEPEAPKRTAKKAAAKKSTSKSKE